MADRLRELAAGHAADPAARHPADPAAKHPADPAATVRALGAHQPAQSTLFGGQYGIGGTHYKAAVQPFALIDGLEHTAGRLRGRRCAVEDVTGAPGERA